MEKIRKGNDISILWEIVTGKQGSEKPYYLIGRSLTLYLSNQFGREKVDDFAVEGNVISWTYLGKNQKHMGVYTLTLVENEGEDDMHTVDACDAFELVRCSCMEGGDAESRIKTEVITLKSAILLNALIVDDKLDVESANAIQNAAVAKEFAKLQGGGPGSIKEFVDNGIGEVLGGASEAYDTLKEIEEYIEKDEAGAVALAQSIAKNAEAIENIPVQKDKSSNGVILKGSNDVAAKDSISIGYSNQASYMGVPIMHCRPLSSGFTDIYLTSKKDVVATVSNTTPDVDTSIDGRDYFLGNDTVFIETYTHGIISAKITNFYSKGAIVRIDKALGFATEIKAHSGLHSKSNKGLYNYTLNAFVFGYNNNIEGNTIGCIGYKNKAERQAEGAYMLGDNLIVTKRGEVALGSNNHSGEDTSFSVGAGFAGRHNDIEIFDNKFYVRGIGNYDGKNVGEKGVLALKDVVAIKSTYYSDLLDYRDNGLLVPGCMYRITDYITTTTQANTKSAGHPFDVIVLALNENTLSERAWAIQSERDADGYFSNSKLEAWQIWYCVDNDTSRFAWADTENGKGVIYRMIDEHNNDCPYDFKNIQFRHPYFPDSFPDWYFTYHTLDKGGDLSVLQDGFRCIGNTVLGSGRLIQNLGAILFINNSVYSYCRFNSVGYDCYNTVFGDSCECNVLGNMCSSTRFGKGCYRNKLGEGSTGNIFGANCLNNSLSQKCSNNTFGSNCTGNSFGNECSDNELGDECVNNSFGNKCLTNILGGGCKNNVFGNACDTNTIGGQFDDNVLGPHCRKNTIGSACKHNKFGAYCQGFSLYNRLTQSSFGSVCKNITISKAYYRNISVGAGCSSIVINNDETSSSGNQVQNYHFVPGLSNFTVDVVRNLAYETTVAKDSSGVIKQFCIADVIL